MQNIINMGTSFICTDECNFNKKYEGKGYKYILTRNNWNDFGYYTSFTLYLIMPQASLNLKLANLSIVTHDQRWNEKPPLYNYNYTSYITNVESAERLLLFLTPDERKSLISELNINFSPGWNKDEKAFLTSTLRGKSLDDFNEIQSKIKSLLLTSEDISSMVRQNLDLIKLL